MILSWLTHSLSPSITSSILWIDKAYDVWDDLRERFSQGDVFRISELQEEIYAFKQENKNVTEYFTELKILWDELLNFRPVPSCTCDVPCSCEALSKIKIYQNNDYVTRFLKGLDDQFGTVRSQIMLMDPLPSINKVFSLVVEQERQMNLGASKVFVHKTNNQQNFKSQQPKRSSGPTNSHGNNDNRFCTFCSKPRHTIETCYKKHGYPPGYKPRNVHSTAHNVVTCDDAEGIEVSALQTDMSKGNLEHSGVTLT
ncbi:hypothetical protein Pint_21995 [Pistacia integerrima]|uniref:Uncharacterized protein n=1 Tax=Pistacia integerrima TaxID=434235 RepID=A0ACC0YN80_9ROSI|nr:hypothetical protein Pint_21995 [Pistacia integerrima]